MTQSAARTDLKSLELTAYPVYQKPYFINLMDHVYQQQTIAERARAKGFDPTYGVESYLAFDLPERVQSMLHLEVADRLRELLSKLGRERAALALAEEVALGRFGFHDRNQALDMAVRVGLAVVTEGITIAPVQGISFVRVKKNDDDTSYVAVGFAGPIRSAGGTEAAFTLVLADHVRKVMGFDKYRIDAFGDDESGRFIEELRIYEREVSNFQYRVSDQDIRLTLLHLPVEIDGVETDPVEVIGRRGLRRIETDRVRGGALRVLNDGLIGRSRKLLKLVDDLGIAEWKWLSELRGERDRSFVEPQSSHFREVISGRPVLSFPGHIGGFRLRYGRCFNTGLSVVGFHPAVAALLEYPFVVGTQVKLDLPGKAATVAFVDTIETPIVKLDDSSVVKVEDVNHAKKIRGRVKKVLHLGDVLISFGDFLENNVPLAPSGYVEEWWAQELEQKFIQGCASIQETARSLGTGVARLRRFFNDSFNTQPTAEEAFTLSEKMHMPLHPSYLYFWEHVPPADVLRLRSSITDVASHARKWTLKIRSEEHIKEILEVIGVPHQVDGDLLRIEGDHGFVIYRMLNPELNESKVVGWKNTLELLSVLSNVEIRRKSSAYVGIRIGRPEKAMPRKMKPPVHILFPVGVRGGPSRDLLEASDDKFEVDMINSVCTNCGSLSPSMRCTFCGGETRVVKTCPNCGKELDGDFCPLCKVAGVNHSSVSFPLTQALKRAAERVGVTPRPPLKGVRGLTNSTKVPEALEKGLLRNKHSLSVYKDGTIRFDVTNAVLTHFRPKDMGASVEDLRKLGYERDISEKPLESPNQLVEIFVQDLMLPVVAGQYFVECAQYVDDLLTKFYGDAPYYNAHSPGDLVGHLVVGLAPHTSVGVVGRIIGFTNAQVCFAHPYWHSAKRRDCDGDGDSLMLLMDMLLNFSKEFLPAQIGGLMDAPLLLQPLVLPAEVQRQGHNFDTAQKYPLSFYESTTKKELPSKVVDIEVVRHRLGRETQFYGFHFTHDTNSITTERERSSYSVLTSLLEKLDRQLELAMKISAVDADQVATSVLRTHILPDIVGNAKAYTSQSLRCKSCGAKVRRYPLTGVCLLCGGELQPTVTRGSVEKYLQIGFDLCRRFKVDEYTKKRFELVSQELMSLFGKSSSQLKLTDF